MAKRFVWHAGTWHTGIVKASILLVAAILAAGLHAADNISVLGTKPRWGVLDCGQHTITREDVEQRINDVYGTHGFARDLIEIQEDRARILMNRDRQKFSPLRFAAGAEELNPVPRIWRPAKG